MCLRPGCRDRWERRPRVESKIFPNVAVSTKKRGPRVCDDRLDGAPKSSLPGNGGKQWRLASIAIAGINPWDSHP